MFSITMSDQATRRCASSSPRGCLRSSVTPYFESLKKAKHPERLSPTWPSLKGGYCSRKPSGRRADSTWTTSAPKLARYLPMQGPAAYAPNSRTFTCSSASVIREPPRAKARLRTQPSRSQKLQRQPVAVARAERVLDECGSDEFDLVSRVVLQQREKNRAAQFRPLIPGRPQ